MTTREAVISVLDVLDEERLVRLLAVAEALVEPERTSSHDIGSEGLDAVETEFINPDVREFTFDSPLWELMGFIKDDGPADMSENHDTYLAQVYGDLHDE